MSKNQSQKLIIKRSYLNNAVHLFRHIYLNMYCIGICSTAVIDIIMVVNIQQKVIFLGKKFEIMLTFLIGISIKSIGAMENTNSLGQVLNSDFIPRTSLILVFFWYVCGGSYTSPEVQLAYSTAPADGTPYCLRNLTDNCLKAYDLFLLQTNVSKITNSYFHIFWNISFCSYVIIACAQYQFIFEILNEIYSLQVNTHSIVTKSATLSLFSFYNVTLFDYKVEKF